MKHSFHILNSKDEKVSFATADFFHEKDRTLYGLKTFLSAFGDKGVALSGLLGCTRGTIVGIRYRRRRDGRKTLSMSRKPRSGIQLILRSQILGRRLIVDICYGENVEMLRDVISIEQFICLYEFSHESKVPHAR